MDLKETGYGGVDWFRVGRNRVQWGVFLWKR